MMRFLSKLLWGGEDTDHPLDFVPVQQHDKRSLSAKLKEARERHGREFRSHTKVERQTERSRDLQELNAKSAPAEPVILLDSHRSGR